MPSFQVLVLGFLFVSFRPSLIRSHSRSSGASLLLSLSGFPLPIRFLSSASLPVLATQPLFLPFLFLPGSASQWLPQCALSALASLALPVFSTWFPVSSFPVLRTRLPVCFLSSFLDSLPQPFLKCFPFALAFGLSPSNPLPFVRFSSGSGYSASASSFPLFPAPPHSGFPGAPFRSRFLAFPVLSDLVSHAVLPGSSYSAFCSFPFALP